MADAFTHRGVIEGFYGTPFAHEDRLWLVEQLGAWGMNRYVYAPKDDPLHRSRWREPYPEEFAKRFAELVGCGERAGVEVGFAISPGLSIRYGSRGDRAALVAKLRSFQAQGVRFFGLCLDDVPSALAHAEDRADFASLAAAHVALAHELAASLGDGATLWLVPTDYLGVAATAYLEELGASLDPRIEVGWTGRTTCSPTIELAEARARAATLRRRLLVWDNVPVSDGPMRPMLHLGPYVGRAPRLAECVSGVLLNPMQHARASALTLRCAARYLADPAGTDAERAWGSAAAEVGAGAPEAFTLFARAHRFSPLTPDDRDAELEPELARLRHALESGADARAPQERLRAALAAREAVGEALRAGLRDRRLLEEIAPWLESFAAETRRMMAALDLLAALGAGGPRKDAVFAFFRFAVRSGEPPPAKVSYGPRRLLYPQLASMRDETMGFGADPWLLRGRNLADDFVALADAEAEKHLATSALA
ncbi:MAG TPA: beta-N-acetylglucosaminidase domain-containing protein [Myxococcota bacterium]|nr:beta-N-acetylglucosaminidase domain-containing protein [Myxococcota bacterium]